MKRANIAAKSSQRLKNEQLFRKPPKQFPYSFNVVCLIQSVLISLEVL